MKPLVFVWNDNEATARSWAIKANGNDQCCSYETQPERVVAQFLESGADMVVLDLLLENDFALGKTIGRAIRAQDKIVPIAFITRNPASLYDNFFEIREVDTCGMFEISVIRTEQAFQSFVVTGAFQYWHSVAPDFVLVRRTVRAMVAHLPSSGTIREAANRLINKVEELPLHSSLEVWHSQLTGEVIQFLTSLGCPELAQRFKTIVGVFEQSDPFYMAASNSRKHLSHNVQVFLLGALFLLTIDGLKRCAKESIHEADRTIPEQDQIWHSLAIWACIALTHDVAYLSQCLTKITAGLRNAAEHFGPAVGAVANQLPIWTWPDIHHGIVGALLWQSGVFPSVSRVAQAGLSGRERAFVSLISKGIARHDHKAISQATQYPQLGIELGALSLDAAHWSQFLAVLSDELQEWLRERDEVRKYFRSFYLDLILVTTDQNQKVKIEMGFSGNNHPRWVRDRVDPSQRALITNRFSEKKTLLETQLSAGRQIDIVLGAHLPDILTNITPVHIFI